MTEYIVVFSPGSYNPPTLTFSGDDYTMTEVRRWMKRNLKNPGDWALIKQP